MNAAEDDSVAGGEIIIPKWMTWVVGLLGAGFIGWMATMSLYVMQIPDIRSDLNRIQIGVDDNEGRLHEHILDPSIHHAAINTLGERFNNLDRRLERFEGKLDKIIDSRQ